MKTEKVTLSKSKHVEEVHPSSLDQTTVTIPLFRALRKWPKVTAYCSAMTSAILLWGYDLAMTGNLAGLDQFKADYGTVLDDEYIIESKWMGAWNAANPVGIMMGSLLGGFIQDRWGRRFSFGFGSLSSILGVAIVYCSHYATGASRHGVFLLGKITQGLTIGIVVCTAQTYMSEVLPSAIRGPIIAFFPIFFLIGQLVSAFIVFAAEDYEGSYAYRICIISEWPFSALPIILAFVIPESPVYLIRKGRTEAAYEAQRRLDTIEMDTRSHVEHLQAVILHELESAQSDNSKYLDCFKGTDLRRTMVVIFAAIVPQLIGLSILGDGPYFMQIAGLESRDSLILLIAGIAGGILGSLGSLYLLTVVGRRKLMIFTAIPVTCFWLAMGISGCFDSVVVGWYSGVTGIIVTFTISVGIWPASYVVGAEVSSLRLRAKTQGVGWAFAGIANCAFSAVTPFIYNADAGNLRSKIGFVWFAICGLAVLGTWYLVPETFGRTALQVDLMFEQRVLARKFQRWNENEISEGS